MTKKSAHNSPILVTGTVGSIGRNLTEMLLAKGHEVRALVRREDDRAEFLRQLGAQVIEGDMTDLTSMHCAIEGCARIYFGMSVSAAYLTATVNTGAVARHHGVEAFVNMSQMTVTQMSITESTDSPQHKLHWLAEQAPAWSALPVVTLRATVFLEGFFRLFAAPGVREADKWALPSGGGKTSPISAVDVAKAASLILDDPAPHIGQIYNLTGDESADLHALRPRLFRGAWPDDPLSRSAGVRVEREASGGRHTSVHRQAPLGDDRAQQAGLLRSHDRRFVQAHGPEAHKHVRLRQAARR
jgi:uncharacterized protein YbjT (DUF2867 family)